MNTDIVWQRLQVKADCRCRKLLRLSSFLCDIEFMVADLTDGVIFLRPLHPEDALDHLAGEDDEMAKWLSGGRSTLATVQGYIASCEEQAD
jgi:hypothetical protein